MFTCVCLCFSCMCVDDQKEGIRFPLKLEL